MPKKKKGKKGKKAQQVDDEPETLAIPQSEMETSATEQPLERQGTDAFFDAEAQAEDEEEAYCEEPRKLFDINNMNTDENSGAEHHCRDREARKYGTLSCLVERGVRYVPERVGQRNGTFEGSNDNNGKDHY